MCKHLSNEQPNGRETHSIPSIKPTGDPTFHLFVTCDTVTTLDFLVKLLVVLQQ
jgi:hypothetical protein